MLTTLHRAARTGMYTYLSYRDPNLLKTVEAYDGTPDFLRTLELDQDALTKVFLNQIIHQRIPFRCRSLCMLSLCGGLGPPFSVVVHLLMLADS